MSDLPAYLRSSAAPRLAERTIANLGTPAPPHLSIKGNRFTLIDAAGSEEPAGDLDKSTGTFFIDGIIVDMLERASRTYYAKPFDPGAQSFAPPDCWSDNGVGPSRQASNPQAPLCMGCPMAEWGSAVSKVSGKGVPACSQTQKIAFLPLGDEMMFLLRVPPASLKNLSSYLSKFKGRDADVRDVVTRISFVKDQLGTLTFHALNYIDQDTYTTREALYAEKKADALVGRDDQPRVGVGLPSMAETRQITANPENRNEAGASQMQQAAAPAADAIGQPEPPKRRRRTQAAEPAPTQATAPFRADPMPAPQGNFGIQQPSAADPTMSKAVDSFFGQ